MKDTIKITETDTDQSARRSGGFDPYDQLRRLTKKQRHAIQVLAAHQQGDEVLPCPATSRGVGDRSMFTLLDLGLVGGTTEVDKSRKPWRAYHRWWLTTLGRMVASAGQP